MRQLDFPSYNPTIINDAERMWYRGERTRKLAEHQKTAVARDAESFRYDTPLSIVLRAMVENWSLERIRNEISHQSECYGV